MKENGAIARISKFLRKENNIQLAIVAVAVVALVAFILTTTLGNTGAGSQPASAEGDGGGATDLSSPEGLESRLEQILTQVDGAGQVRVLVTYETGPEIVPAVKTGTQSDTADDGSGQGSTTSMTQDSEPVVVQGKNGTEPMVLMMKEPVVLGVLVVAEGASELDVRLRLMQAVQVALQIAPDRIEVLPMNISNSREGN